MALQDLIVSFAVAVGPGAHLYVVLSEIMVIRQVEVSALVFVVRPPDLSLKTNKHSLITTIVCV